jgi:hypothetical protein
VYDILQDHRGYLWFATDRGVARYDGKDYKTYTRSEGLSDNTVFRMCEDHQGRIWFASQNQDLCYWYRDTIHRLPSSDILHSLTGPDDIINLIYADSNDDLWINFRKIAVVFHAKENYTTFEKVTANPNCNYEIGLIDDAEPIRLYGPLDNLKKDHWEILFDFHKRTEPSNIKSFHLSFKDLSPPFIIGARAYSKKTKTYYFSCNNYLITMKDGLLNGFLLDHNIVKIIPDKEGNLWIGLHKKGVRFYKDEDLTKPPIALLDGTTVDDVWMDHESGVWLATLEKGVFYIPSTSIVTYQHAFLNDHITFIGELDQKIYISTGPVIAEQQPSGFKVHEELTRLAGKRGGMYTLKKIRDTTYANFSGELIRYAGEMKPANQLPQTNTRYQGEFSGGKVQLETADHRIWLVNGGWLKNINNQTCNAVLYKAPFRVTTAVAQGNTILVGGKNGLYRFENGLYTSLSYMDPLLKTQIIEITFDKSGALWIATIGEGVLRLKNSKVKQITENNGLVSNICTSIATDKYGNIWVGTNKGISCIQKPDAENNKWRIKNLEERNGLNSDDITKLFCTGNTVWAGTMSGLSCIDIVKSLQPIPPSPVYIDSIQVMGTPVGQRTSFSYKENDVFFKLHSLAFKDNGQHNFRFWLKEKDTTWRFISDEQLLIGNLSPGHYTFEVQAANLDNIWSTIPATYSFTINQPFWLTWWLIGIEVLVLIAIVYLVILWRTRNIKRKEAEKLRINKLLTEYQMKALTAQMNPHFIFNAINSIQNFIIQNHSTLAYDYLIKFSKLIRLVLNNSKDNEITLQLELDTLALYIELEQLRFKDSFDYELRLQPGIDTESLMIPALLLQPYIENAIWHGLMPLKTQKGKIALTIIEQEQHLRITITDNGVGRRASNQIKKKITHKTHQSVGMELTGKRIELFGQERQFSIQIIDNYDTNDNSTGTTVEIILPMVELF